MDSFDFSFDKNLAVYYDDLFGYRFFSFLFFEREILKRNKKNIFLKIKNIERHDITY